LGAIRASPVGGALAFDRVSRALGHHHALSVMVAVGRAVRNVCQSRALAWTHTYDAGCWYARYPGQSMCEQSASRQPSAHKHWPDVRLHDPRTNTRSLLGPGTRSFLHTTTTRLSGRGDPRGPQIGHHVRTEQSRSGPSAQPTRHWQWGTPESAAVHTPLSGLVQLLLHTGTVPIDDHQSGRLLGKNKGRNGTRAVVGLAGRAGPVGVTPAEGLRSGVADAEAIVAERRLAGTVRCLAQPPIKKSVEPIRDHKQRQTSQRETYGSRRRNRPSQPGTRNGVA
jgi:hypothetical protein